MIRRPQRSKRTDTRFAYTTLVRAVEMLATPGPARSPAASTRMAVALALIRSGWLAALRKGRAKKTGLSADASTRTALAEADTALHSALAGGLVVNLLSGGRRVDAQ